MDVIITHVNSVYIEMEQWSLQICVSTHPTFINVPVRKYYSTYECYWGATFSQTIILLCQSALPNYIVACLLLWASTHVMTMSISILFLLGISCLKPRYHMVAQCPSLFYNYDFLFGATSKKYVCCCVIILELGDVGQYPS